MLPLLPMQKNNMPRCQPRGRLGRGSQSLPQRERPRPQEYIVIRGFTSGGEGYRRGDRYPVDDPARHAAVTLLIRHGLIAPVNEAEKGGGSHGGDGGDLPPIRGV